MNGKRCVNEWGMKIANIENFLSAYTQRHATVGNTDMSTIFNCCRWFLHYICSNCDAYFGRIKVNFSTQSVALGIDWNSETTTINNRLLALHTQFGKIGFCLCSFGWWSIIPFIIIIIIIISGEAFTFHRLSGNVVVYTNTYKWTFAHNNAIPK